MAQTGSNALDRLVNEKAVEFPEFNIVAEEKAGIAWYGETRLNLPDTMQFAILEPGNWLFIPAGTWHFKFSKGSIPATLALH